MTQKQAKEWLSGLRPGDHADVRGSGEWELIAALDMLETDAELRAWYEAECALDEVIFGKFAEAIILPADIKATLMQGLRNQDAPITGSGTAVPFRGGWILAAAAAVALFVVVGVRMNRSEPGPEPLIAQAEGLSFASFREEMADYALTKVSLGHKANDWSELNDWLATKTPIKCGDLPKGIASLKTMGCNVVDWGEKHVSLYCFKKGATGEVVHLFVVDKVDMGDVPPCKILNQPRVSHGVETAGWQDEEKVYLLIGSKPGVVVSELL